MRIHTVEQNSSEHTPNLRVAFRTVAGVMLIASGATLFLEQYLKTGWLALIILPVIGLFLYQWGLRLRHPGLIISGGVMGGVGLGAAAAVLNPAASVDFLYIPLGNAFGFFALGWAAITLGTMFFSTRPAYWTLIPAGVFGGLSAFLLFTPRNWWDLILFIGLGVGLPLLIWGLAERLFGLVIPGCILSTVGPGIYVAWGSHQEPNGLVQTGIMLVWFSMGWALMAVLSRTMNLRYTWWPLIPAGILAVVGFGLYIGGDPGNALVFISNTGSITLIIFGLYLLLMRRGIHH